MTKILDSNLRGIIDRARTTIQPVLVDFSGAWTLWRHGATVTSMSHDVGIGLYEATLEYEHDGTKFVFAYKGKRPMLTQARRAEINDKINAWFDQLPKVDQDRYEGFQKTNDYANMRAMSSPGTGIPEIELTVSVEMRWEELLQLSAASDLPD